VELYRNRIAVEIGLALLAVAYVAWMLLATSPSSWEPYGNPYLFLIGAVTVGVWLPLLARTRGSGLGFLRREGDAVIVRAGRRTWRIPATRVRGVHVAQAARGASLLLSCEDGTVVAAAVDDLEDARRFADALGAESGAIETVYLPLCRYGFLPAALRVGTTLLAVAFAMTRGVGDGDALGVAAFAGGVLLALVHVTRHRTRPLGSPPPTAREHTRALREHLVLHAADVADPPAAPRPRFAELDEPLDRALPRLRRDLGSGEAYRAAAQTLRERLERVLGSAAVPLRERAVALRVLAARDRDEVRRRIAAMETLPDEEQAFLEAVALEESDEAALARAAERPPDFEGWRRA
jgi:hypothetical protein